ncbi:MAG: (Fe-S)-binding protein [Candidatus Bathyarchaeia archaeon]
MDKTFVNELLSKEDCKEVRYCIQCGVCTGACPLSPFGSQNPRRLIAMIREGLKTAVLEALDLCLLCGQCQMLCPRGVKLKEVLLNLRQLSFNMGKVNEGLSFVNELLSEQFNPYMQPPEARRQWIEGTGITIETKEKSRIVYFVGCTASYMEVSQEIPRTITKILTRINEDWTLLEEEWCCGMPFLFIGNVEKAKEFAAHNVEEIRKKGAEAVITGCPTCWHTIKYRYPKLLNTTLDFEVVHITEYLANKISQGEIKIKNKITERVTFHDPCDLARYSVIKPPREILRRIAEDFVEMQFHGKDTICCGGGGLMEAINSKLRSNITMKRIKLARGVGAKILATSCGGCKYYLSQAAAEDKNRLIVKDVVELLYDCME